MEEIKLVEVRDILTKTKSNGGNKVGRSFQDFFNLIPFIFALFALLLNSCIKNNNKFSSDYENQFNNYLLNDTLFFQDSNKNLESFFISEIDSSSSNTISINTGLFFSKIIRVNHLPKNLWYDYKEYSKINKKYDSIVDQVFISISKDQHSNNIKDDVYNFWVSYRDFSSSLDLKEIKNKKIDTIKNASTSNKPKEIKEIYWDYKKGMIGYKKENGSIFKLVGNGAE